MVTPVYTIVWTKRAQIHLRNIYDYISKDSEQNAKKVVQEIVLSMNKATKNPEFYPPDKYKKNNTSKSYRAYELYRYRIAYRIRADELVVLRVRHTGMEPKEY